MLEQQLQAEKWISLRQRTETAKMKTTSRTTDVVLMASVYPHVSNLNSCLFSFST